MKNWINEICTKMEYKKTDFMKEAEKMASD